MMFLSLFSFSGIVALIVWVPFPKRLIDCGFLKYNLLEAMKFYVSYSSINLPFLPST